MNYEINVKKKEGWLKINEFSLSSESPGILIRDFATEFIKLLDLSFDPNTGLYLTELLQDELIKGLDEAKNNISISLPVKRDTEDDLVYISRCRSFIDELERRNRNK